MTTSRTSRWLGAALATGLAVTAGCTGSSGATTSGPSPFSDPVVAAGEFRLVSFDSCDEASEKLRAAARRHVGPWGFGQYGEISLFAAEQDGAAEEMAGDAAAPAAALPAEALRGTDPAAPQHSGTNVHESGVDEPDLVKTDGRRIVTVHRGTLRVIDARRRVETGAVPLGPDPAQWQVADLLLHGDQALVLMRETWAAWDGPMPVEPGFGARDDLLPGPEHIFGPRLLLVDLTGVAPRVLSEYTVDGSLVDARQVGSVARVVVRSGPRLDFPQLDDATEAQRTAANQRVVDAAEMADWLPRYTVRSGDRTRTGQVDCTAVSRPATYTGTTMVTVLTFDLATRSLGDGDPVSVVADGDTVYSNGTSLYVANDHRGWFGPETDDRTEIYQFDTSSAGPPRYVAAGAVDGWLINQYAMSEWDGHLRVATTAGDTWRGGGDSESTVYVLARRGEALVETGSVGGLGKGERIYSVRFVGPLGYVVTFRETDPLYTVDLRDPAAPTVLGELKITGYSAYLHPVGAGRLLGVGQEADLRGRVQGTQVSLFDVSDLSDPAVLAQHHVRYGQSEAEFDPHAFLWWPATRTLVLPLTVYEWEGRHQPESGALVLRVDDDGFTERALITHPPSNDWDFSSQIRRSLVLGDTLWTVSDLGLQANSLTTLDRVGWVPFT